MIIKNLDRLVSHGNIKGRKIIIDIIEHAIKAVDAYEATKRNVKLGNGKLVVENLSYCLSTIKHIYVIGAGKATFPIAKALEDILGDKIDEGIVIVKRGEKRRLKRIKVLEASHPIPDEAGLEGTKEIVNIAQKASDQDLVFCAITGGASALMPLPAENITLEDKKKVTDLLLKCGATIDEINTVRNHISIVKGGKLAKIIHPAKIINLIVIDEIAGRPWGPTAPDDTTFRDAIAVLNKYGLWEDVPEAVRQYLVKGATDPRMETLRSKDFRSLYVQNVILASNKELCEAAKKRAEELNLNSLILTKRLEGESREAGIVLASIAREIEDCNQPIRRPCAIILGGETTVKITGLCGKGGPSQEFALGAAIKIAGSKKIVVASIDTDGTDGPTEIAGGIVDGYTLNRAKKNGIDIYECLMKHNTHEALLALQDALITGPTNTNVMDLNVAVIIN